MKTIALVIGNDKYSTSLDNAVNDAKGIANAFERLRYDVIAKYDCTRDDYNDLLYEFKEKIKDYDSAIFYYSGHGFQFNDENFLASIECPIDSPNRYMCQSYSIRLKEILDIFKNAQTRVNIVIIDACRRNVERGDANTFATTHAPKGTLIAFSTSPGDGAWDKGMEGHSVYTGALLQYIGREFLSVEELFKKVRKTVHNLTGGVQTTWEHTSLVDDFFFNDGNMIYSIEIPYAETVVKDRDYVINKNIVDDIISDLQSRNWFLQNPAIERLRKISPADIDINQQFLLGRNILQSGSHANVATNFLENLDENLSRYNVDGINHVLNGILFEIYFDSVGNFRRENFKSHHFRSVFQLRKLAKYEKSFDFIGMVLEPYRDELFYIPSNKDVIIDVDILATEQETTNIFGEKEIFQVIEKVTVSSKDITKKMSNMCNYGTNKHHIEDMLSRYFLAPVDVINVISNIEIKKLVFRRNLDI